MKQPLDETTSSHPANANTAPIASNLALDIAPSTVTLMNAKKDQPVRFAIAGLGHFAQSAILPAFANAADKAVLVALVTGNAEKARELGKTYNVATYEYAEYEQMLASGTVDAVYIATPNSEHRVYTERAAAAGVHVLCEKPLASTVEDAEAMVNACRTANVQLMTAYRLHFEEGNLQAIEAVKNGKIGSPRLFHATHTMQVTRDNVRTDLSLGGGPLEDIGIYCLNAARHLFQDEPTEVVAFAASSNDPRFAEIPESVCATLRFPEGRLATFQCGFGSCKSSEFRVIGTEGILQLDPAFTWHEAIRHKLVTADDQETHTTYPHRDQIAAEIVYFAECIQEGREPEPSGYEGWIDTVIIDALRTSYTQNRPVAIPALPQKPQPDVSQSIRRSPPWSKPQLVKASAPSEG